MVQRTYGRQDAECGHEAMWVGSVYVEELVELATLANKGCLGYVDYLSSYPPEVNLKCFGQTLRQAAVKM